MNDSLEVKPNGPKQDLLRRIPSITDLLKSERVAAWLREQPLSVVSRCLRQAAADLRQDILKDSVGACGTEHVSADAVLDRAADVLARATTPHIRAAINATGIILHTGLGRAVFADSVVDSIESELKGYATLAVDPETGERAERDELVEYILKELTGAEAATVVNNNAAATLLVLAGLTARKDVLVSRGQLIEIGGSFRLPEVMQQSGARLVEVGATNRTHAKDYANAVSADTAAILRVHPSNYRIIGFTSEPTLPELVEIAHGHGALLIDDLGAGALVDLAKFGLPHEPMVSESVAAGADIVLFSGDKLIGASQAGIIVGRKPLIDALRKHPLMRAVRADKTCLMVLERTLQLFRDQDRLRQLHPTYRMLCATVEQLEARAGELIRLIARSAPGVSVAIRPSTAYLGSGSLPAEAIPSVAVQVSVADLGASELSRRLRIDNACVFGRIENERVLLDVRTVTDEQCGKIASALGRIAG